MLILVSGIQIYQIATLISLVILNKCFIFVEGKILTVNIFKEGKILCTVVEVFLRKHTVVDKQLQIVPLCLEILTVVFENLCQAVGYFLGNISSYLLYIGITLQIRTADIQRNIRRINYTMQQCEEVRNYAFNLVGDEDLIAIELNFVALQVDTVMNAREIEDTCEVEGEINIEMNPEQRLVLHGIKRVIELLIILIFKCRRSLNPQWFNAVDNVILVSFNLLTILPFGFFAKNNRHCHKFTVLVQQLLNL